LSQLSKVTDIPQ